jgi:GNAT superfamily N-acetyltransferase
VTRFHLQRDLNILKEIYNDSWDNNWGFVPMSAAELDDMIAVIRRHIRPELALIAEVNGQTAGFVLAFPDINQALLHARPRPGKPELVSRAQTLWHWRLRSKINRVRIPLMGIRNEYRGIGVEAALFVRMYEEAIQLSQRTGWKYADAGWVLEANAPMQRLIESYSGAPYKRYAIYERVLEPMSIGMPLTMKPMIPSHYHTLRHRVTMRPRQVVVRLPMHAPRGLRRPHLHWTPPQRVQVTKWVRDRLSTTRAKL